MIRPWTGSSQRVADTIRLDCHPPQLRDVLATQIEDTRVTIKATADEPVRLRVRYGPQRDQLTQSAEAQTAANPISRELTGLNPCSTYYYNVEIDRRGRQHGQF